MTTSEAMPYPPTLESVLRDAWNAFQPHQPTPLGWVTHTTTQIHAYLRDHTSPLPPPQPAASGDADSLAHFRRQVWQALRDAASEHDIDIDAADRVLHALDLPGLPRRWQVRLTLPITVEVTAPSSEDAFDTAEAAIETALTASGHDTHIDWDRHAREDATPGEHDTAAAEPADLR
ncbi:hypothetical protein [Micromonospora sp. NPDC050200]|uniref:hypothetical protein n=1 Tax=Micromonospora sp. NPDC050200 TaxID=3155664 RepID=UPI0033F87ACF